MSSKFGIINDDRCQLLKFSDSEGCCLKDDWRKDRHQANGGGRNPLQRYNGERETLPSQRILLRTVS